VPTYNVGSTICRTPIIMSFFPPARPLDTPLTEDDIDRFHELLERISADDPDGLPLESVDGFITALVCGPRPVMPSEYLPVLFGENDPARFADTAEFETFLELFNRRWNQIAAALCAPVEDLADPRALMPLVMDWEAMVAELPPAERTAAAGQYIPPFASLWAAGFLIAVESWEADWALPDGSKDEAFVDALLDPFYILTERPEDLTAKERAISREAYFAQAIWNAYDLRAFWQDRASGRTVPFRKPAEPGRNDPCPCGSGKKFKKCCGAP
jgi:uncharacterized protein